MKTSGPPDRHKPLSADQIRFLLSEFRIDIETRNWMVNHWHLSDTDFEREYQKHLQAHLEEERSKKDRPKPV